jgi:hypothetical protein
LCIGSCPSFHPTNSFNSTGASAGHNGWYISDAWDKLSPKAVSALLIDPETQTAILGLLSFHRNGYVREEAVRLLASVNDGTELPFLLIGQNDWVDVIGVEAQLAVSERLRPAYLPFFVHNLPLVLHLLDFRRRDLSPLVRKVVEMLVRPQHDALLAEVIGASNRYVCRKVVQIALDVPADHAASVVRHGLASADVVVRLASAQRIQQTLSGEELRQAIGLLQQDPFMPVRREGLQDRWITNLKAGVGRRSRLTTLLQLSRWNRPPTVTTSWTLLPILRITARR